MGKTTLKNSKKIDFWVFRINKKISRALDFIYLISHSFHLYSIDN